MSSSTNRILPFLLATKESSHRPTDNEPISNSLSSCLNLLVSISFFVTDVGQCRRRRSMTFKSSLGRRILCRHPSLGQSIQKSLESLFQKYIKQVDRQVECDQSRNRYQQGGRSSNRTMSTPLFVHPLSWTRRPMDASLSLLFSVVRGRVLFCLVEIA